MDAVVWWARPDATSDALLTEDERARMRALRHAEDQAAFLSAHVLTRHLVAGVTGAQPERVVLWATCDRCGGPHGAPRVTVDGVDGRHVTISRCREAVVVAVSSARIGVDVEALGRTRTGLAEAALSRTELELLEQVPAGERDDVLTRWWVRKEAVLKAIGTGLDVDPRIVEVAGPSTPHGCGLFELELAPTLAACLAVRTSEPVDVDVRRVELS